jgi:hypothetical protein
MLSLYVASSASIGAITADFLSKTPRDKYGILHAAPVNSQLAKLPGALGVRRW